MTERHDIILRPADGENPPDLLKQIVEDVKKLVPTGGKALRKYVEAKGEEAEARVGEIKARIYQNIGQLELERQRLIEQRDEAKEKVKRQARRDRDARKAKAKELEIQLLHERMQALREVVDCIVKLRELGIEIDLKLVEKVQEALTRVVEE
ncbi:MAG: hypothetical protein ABFE13_01470 [Phycisphaerales bacterium]